MSKVVTFGSLNMDLTIACARLPQAGETVEGSDLILNPGGKGGNQAVAAARAGAHSQMIACVGADVFGRELLEALKTYGVDTAYVQTRADTPTGMAFITRHHNDNRIILHAGANRALTGGEVCDILKENACAGDLFVTQFECDLEATFAAVAQAHRMGLYTIVNPAPAKEIPDHVYQQVDLLVLNETEAQFLTGIPAQGTENLNRALDWFESRGVGSVIITLGDAGSIVRCQGRTFTVPARRVAVVDTTAAGDTYIGALAASLSRGKTMEESTQFATAAAALAIGRCGAQQSIPDQTAIQQFLKEEPLC